MLAVFNGCEDQIFCRSGTADQLNNDIDVRSTHQGKRIVNDFSAAVDDLACFRNILVGHSLDYDGAASATTDLLAVTAQDREGSAAYGADTQQANIHRFHWNSFLNENDEIKNPSRK